MKKLLVVLFVLAACASYAQAPRYWPTWMDESGAMKNTSASAPMPVSTSITVGSITVSAGEKPDTVSNSYVTCNATVATITALANRVDISVFNLGTETAWLTPGNLLGTVSQAIPLYSGGFFSREADSAMTFSYISSTPTTLFIHQAGY